LGLEEPVSCSLGHAGWAPLAVQHGVVQQAVVQQVLAQQVLAQHGVAQHGVVCALFATGPQHGCCAETRWVVGQMLAPEEPDTPSARTTTKPSKDRSQRRITEPCTAGARF
jgi:hypothetical protein